MFFAHGFRFLIAVLVLGASTIHAISNDLVVLDRPLVTSAGETLGFRSDVIGDHPIVIGFIFTGCASVCPVSVLIQESIDGLEKADGLRQVTMTVDPLGDTPEQLAVFAAEVTEPDDAWLWLSGAPDDVFAVLDGLGASGPLPDEHPAVFIVGSGKTNRFERLYGLPKPDELIARAYALHEE